jgi:hypothetical protein
MSNKSNKRQIRWLQSFRQQIPYGHTKWGPRDEFPDVLRDGNYIVFERGCEMAVYVNEAIPPTISVPRAGELVGAIEGKHFEFIDGRSEAANPHDNSADDSDELRQALKFTHEDVRRILMGFVVNELVSFFNDRPFEQKSTDRLCQILEGCRRRLASDSAPSSVQSYLSNFLKRASFDLANLRLML